MRKADLLNFALFSDSFDIEFEILAKAIKKGMRIVEVPISHKSLTYKEGRKFRIGNGFWTFLRIFYFRFGKT